MVTCSAAAHSKSLFEGRPTWSNCTRAPMWMKTLGHVIPSWRHKIFLTVPGLKTLLVEVVGVPNPDVIMGHDGRPVQGEIFRGTVEQSCEIQRCIYSQLAELEDLEMLQLGHTNYDFDNL
ncbi:hypothetical protein BGZ81_005579 [Podila clonocystis]|nr:hypothetical protein BGZ81_005579 [Podila clonocystis]